MFDLFVLIQPSVLTDIPLFFIGLLFFVQLLNFQHVRCQTFLE